MPRYQLLSRPDPLRSERQTVLQEFDDPIEAAGTCYRTPETVVLDVRDEMIWTPQDGWRIPVAYVRCRTCRGAKVRLSGDRRRICEVCNGTGEMAVPKLSGTYVG